MYFHECFILVLLPERLRRFGEIELGAQAGRSRSQSELE
jgi:hypothetical protein